MISILRRYIRYNHGLTGAIRRLLGAAWTLLKTQGAAGLLRQWRETRLRMKQLEREAQRVRALQIYQARRTLRILATRHTTYVAHMLDAQFRRFGISSELIVDLQHKPDPHMLYLVVCPQMFARVPRHMIAFQMEQSTSERWFDEKYLGRLTDAIAILDYSIANIGYLQSRDIPSNLLYYHQVRPVQDYRTYLDALGIHINQPGEITYDAVFYGDMRCARRRHMLDALSGRFRILVISEVFGAELYAGLLKARAVLNIHYYEPSLLETTRISECVSLGIPVISERGMSSDVHEDWGGWVTYVPVGDVEAMATEIERLKHGTQSAGAFYRHSRAAAQAEDLETARLLLGCGLIEPAELTRLDPLVDLDGHTPVCLSLPETPQRRSHAVQSAIQHVRFFDGMRHVQAWRGCALSYWYLASVTARSQAPWLEVYEDDCEFLPDSGRSLEIVREYLRDLGENWDVFSALITTLPAQTRISKIEVFQGLKFVHLDKTMGMVYSIFNRTACTHLAEWDFSNDDASSNTIDRYLLSKGNLRVITCMPYLVGHHEEVNSTLWSFGNQAYSSLIAAAEDELGRLVQQFEAGRMAK